MRLWTHIKSNRCEQTCQLFMNQALRFEIERFSDGAPECFPRLNLMTDILSHFPVTLRRYKCISAGAILSGTISIPTPVKFDWAISMHAEHSKGALRRHWF